MLSPLFVLSSFLVQTPYSCPDSPARVGEGPKKSSRKTTWIVAIRELRPFKLLVTFGFWRLPLDAGEDSDEWDNVYKVN